MYTAQWIHAEANASCAVIHTHVRKLPMTTIKVHMYMCTSGAGDSYHLHHLHSVVLHVHNWVSVTLEFGYVSGTLRVECQEAMYVHDEKP